MEDFSDIYANTKYHSSHGGSLTRRVQTTKKQRRYQHTIICLCLLIALLLAATIALIIIVTSRAQCSSSSISEENLVLTNLTEQMRNLELEYSTCRSERDSLATSHTTDTKRISTFQQELDTLRKIIEDTWPEAWTRLGSGIYFVSMGTKSWSSSRELCRQRGADLVIINSREEQEFIRSLNKTVWIGLTDKINNTWTWVDGTQLTTQYWATGEPNKARKEEDCAANLVGVDTLKSWIDERCQLEYAWVCEKMVFNSC